MNYFTLHLGDYAEATSHLSLIEDGIYFRLIRKYYAREKPLPADLDKIAEWAVARSRQERQALDKVLSEFFELRDDGYHQQRCDEAIADYLEGEPEREAKRENGKSRKKRFRERRAQLFEELRALGKTPAWDTPMTELERMVAAHTKNAPGTHLERVPGVHLERTWNAPGTATHSPFPIPHSPNGKTPPNPLAAEGAVRRRRSPHRAAQDEARLVWSELITHKDTKPRTPRLQAALDAIGGYQRIKLRTERDEPQIRREFCEAYVRAGEAAA